MKLFGLCLAALVAGTAGAFSESEPGPSEAFGNWTLMQSADGFDGDQRLRLVLNSIQKIQCETGKSDCVALFVGCDENEFSFFAGTPCNMTYAPGSDHAYIDYRIDEGPVQTDLLHVSASDSRMISHPRGPRSAEAIRKILGKETMLLRLAPYQQVRDVAVFDISGLDEAIEPLRKAYIS